MLTITMFRDKIQISRERFEFYYSIAILVTIPVLMVANTLMLAFSVRSSFDSELRRKADLANTVVAAASRAKLYDTEALQKDITTIKQDSDELTNISIAHPEANAAGFVIDADSDESQVGKSTRDLQFVLAADRRQSIAKLVTDADKNRNWQVVSPIIVDDKVAAVVSTTVSLQRSDALIGKTLLRSLVVVVVTVIVIVLLLLNHFRFVEYAMLFRKLKEVDQLKNDFLSVATHELRAPMTVIKGDIENLMDGLTGTVDEKGKQALDAMRVETDRLNSLVTDLLNVSRLEQGRISYNLEVFDTREVIEKISQQFVAKAREKGLELNYQKPEVAAMVNIDKGRFTEIMTNLIDNAIKYSQTGTVTVAHKPDPGKARISVRDTGIGMTAEARDRLFSRFYRIQNEQTKGIPGTGLGLWITKQYIEHMDGTIQVDSLEGVGSEFVVEFPLASEAPASPLKTS